MFTILLTIQVSRSCRLRPRLQRSCTQFRPCALQIDRRKHLELAYKRQEEHDALIAEQTSSLSPGQMIEVRDLAHLEAVLEKAGSYLVVVFFYSKVS